MTDPRDQDDNWGELYRELGVDDPGTPKPAPSDDEDVEVIELTESEPESDDLGEPAQPFDEVESEEPAEVGAAEGEEEGEPGQKKRRRRRRRRKKKGAAGQPGEAAGEEAGGFDGDGEESETQLEGDEEESEATTGPGVEEEVTPEMTRDIIANWNVPSWEEIVTGLHRPDR